uniref:integrase n=1 Tax=Streptomyces sp. HK1 TaxID=405041 RepID=UPI001F369E8B|nr:integrase [Streptomyces sp. HK1]
MRTLPETGTKTLPETENTGRAAAARRLAEAEDLADAVAAEITPDNTYRKSWRVWTRFCAATRLRELEATRGALVGLRDLDAARRPAERHRLRPQFGLHPPGGRRRRPAPARRARPRRRPGRRPLRPGGPDRPPPPGRRAARPRQGTHRDRHRAAGTVRACPDTLAGARDKALVLTGFHYAARAQDPAGLLVSDVTEEERGLIIAILTCKTKHSVRAAKIPYSADPAICPVRARKAYRTCLVLEADFRWSAPTAPAFVGIDRWGHVTGGMGPDSVTRAITRISQRAGVPVAWTGHSLRIGLAATAREAVADQGGWARHSRSMLGYMQTEDGWTDNAAAGLT